MLDSVIIISCLEVLFCWFLEIAGCLDFISVVAVIFFFALVLVWALYKGKGHE